MFLRTGSAAGTSTLSDHRPVASRSRWLPAVLASGLVYGSAMGCGVSANPQPVVSSKAMEIRTQRVRESLLRFVRFNTESGYPCLRFEIIRPTQNWQVMHQKDVCGIKPANGQRIDLETDVAFVEFIDIEINESGFGFTVGYTPRAATGEYQSLCRMRLNRDQSLSGPDCGEARRL